MIDTPSGVAKNLAVHSQMVKARANAESTYRSIAAMIDPQTDTFSGENTTYTRVTELFDSTAPLALMRYQAIYEQILTPRSTVWHGMQAPTSVGEVGKSREAKTYYENVVDVLFEGRYAGKSNFTGATGDAYRNLGMFGTIPLYIDSGPTGAIRYMCVPAAELWWTRDQWGRLTRVHRKYKIRNEDLIKEFRDGDLTEQMKHDATEKPLHEIEILHCVYDNLNYVEGRMDRHGMKYASRHIAVSTKHELRASGYRTQPYIIGTHRVGNGKTYPSSPGLDALASMRMLNQMGRSQIAYANRAAEPPQLTASSNMPPPLLQPNAINPGYLSADGKRLMLPMEQGGDYNISLEQQNKERSVVDAFFHVDLFQILIDMPGRMTATEVLERAQEKGVLIAPGMGRQQAMMLAPMIEREIDLQYSAGALPDMPESVASYGGVYDISYTSSMAKLMRADRAVGISRSVEAMAPFTELGRPEWLDNIDVDEAARTIFDVYGAPADVLLPEDDVAKGREARQEKQQQVDAAAQIGAAAPAVKDMADAAATVEGMGGA